MRNRPQKTSASQVPEQPKKPFLTLNDLSKTITYTPIWLEGEPEKKIAGTNETDYDSDGQFALLIGPVGARACINYRVKYTDTVDMTIMKILYLLSLMDKAGENSPEGLDAVKMLSSSVIETPFGTVAVPVEELMMQLIAFILSVNGRIVKQKGDNDYDTEAISVEDIIDATQKSAVFRRGDDNTSIIFYDIIEAAGLWNRNAVSNAVEQEARESGNTTASSSEDAKESKI